jgi:flagellar hook-basal body complex protein FliE
MMINAIGFQIQPDFTGLQNVQPQVNASAGIGDFATQLAETLRAGEQAAIAGVAGSLPLHQTVEKVLEAERTLSAAVSIRDKIVSAYLELSRMQI